MRILVTGANGYLGSGVVKRLLNDGIEVIATDNQNKHIDNRAHFIEADLFEVEEPYEFFGTAQKKAAGVQFVRGCTGGRNEV